MDSIKSYYIVPLFNIDPQGMDPQIFPDGYKLVSTQEFLTQYRPFLTNYLGDLEQDVRMAVRGQMDGRVVAMYLLIKELQVQPLIANQRVSPDINDELYKREQETIIKWLFALRLLYPGNIQVNQAYSVNKSFYASYCLSVGTMIDNLDNVWNFSKDELCSLDNYSLSRVKREELAVMITKCSKNYSSMKIPLNYWIAYYQERELINKIIKLATVWEVTLLNDKKNELQYALKMRGSCVLRRDARKIFELAYSVRSELLHTGLVEHKTINRINEFLGTHYKHEWSTLFYFMKDVLEPMTREILNYFLDALDQNHVNLEETARDIDNKICAFIEPNKF